MEEPAEQQEEKIQRPPLQILYQDEYLVAVNKPYGYLTHKSAIDPYAKEIVLQTLRDQIQQSVYPAHRLDRKTTGVLLFALNPVVHQTLAKGFQEGEMLKRYWAVVRGFVPEAGTIDYPLMNDNGKLQQAVSHYIPLQQTEMPWPLGKHPTSRYTLLELTPETGRMHQLRRHLSHVFHPIIGDRPHGCNKQNRFFKEQWQYSEMLLHARHLAFRHPIHQEATIRIDAPLFSEYERMLAILSIANPALRAC